MDLVDTDEEAGDDGELSTSPDKRKKGKKGSKRKAEKEKRDAGSNMDLVDTDEESGGDDEPPSKKKRSAFNNKSGAPIEQTSPATAHSKHHRKPVEQCCAKTGDFLREFASLSDACRALGISRTNSSHISDVCAGKNHRTAFGYFWRWKGSDAVPRALKGMVKIIQVRRKSSEGPPEREFWSVEEAAKWIGESTDVEKIRRWCREEKVTTHLSRYWTYDIRKPLKEEKHVTKRIRIKLHDDNDDHWEEGTVERYDPTTKHYHIGLDNGVTLSFDLGDDKAAEYEFLEGGSDENHNGNADDNLVVEKLCLSTGKVLGSYPSVGAAANNMVEESQIELVLQNAAPSAGGYFWRSAGSSRMPFRKRSTTGKTVEQVSVETDAVMATFPSAVAAAKELGISRNVIREYCMDYPDRISPCGTFRLRYKGQEE